MPKDTDHTDSIAAVILFGVTDFGRCPLASRLQRSVWPLADTCVLQNLVDHIAHHGVTELVICCRSRTQIIRNLLNIPQDLKIIFHEEALPAGSAGSIRDAARLCAGKLLVVFHAAMLAPPDIAEIVRAHKCFQADMTVLFNPSDEKGTSSPSSAQVYVCDRSIIEYIPRQGYSDIKEGLIPILIREGKPVRAAFTSGNVGHFRSWRQYLDASAYFLKHVAPGRTQNADHDCDNNVWLAKNTSIHPTARIVGPAIICEGAVMRRKTVLLGPAIIGVNAMMEEGAVISESVLWDNCRISRNACIDRCLVDHNAFVPPDSFIKDDLVVRKRSYLSDTFETVAIAANDVKQKLADSVNTLNITVKRFLPRQSKSTSPLKNPMIVAAVLLLFFTFIANYWRPVIADLWQIWNQSDEYSSGMLVPLIAVWVIYARRKKLRRCPVNPSMWGVVVFVFAQALRFFGLFFMYDSAQRLSMIGTIAAIVLLLFGTKLFFRLATVLLLLILMIPLPNRIQLNIMLPLQQMATSSAVFCLETIGYSVIRQGNIISIGDTTIAVAEACNGLRMLTAFITISTLIAMVSNRGLWQKAALVASSIPIAFVCNTIRLTLTSIAFTVIDGETWETTFHDFGGFAMMPLALALMCAELYLFSNIVITDTPHKADIIVRAVYDTNVKHKV